MSKINDVYAKINELNDLIDNEPENSLKRKIKLEMEIEEIEKEKRRAGFHRDYMAVKKYNAKIREIEQKFGIDYVSIYKKDILSNQKKILNIIIKYYKQGFTIEEIIKKEDVLPHISDSWFDFSDFGKNTGYLFVENIDDGDKYWRYSNPIFLKEFSCQYFDELKQKIKDEKEVFLLFDEELANNTENRDIFICQHLIDKNLDCLNDFSGDFKKIFNNLKIHSNKFKKSQLLQLCETVLNNPNLSNLDIFKYILEDNKSKLDDGFCEMIYPRIIDTKLRYLESNFNDIGVVIADLNVFADYFSKRQLNHLNIFIKKAPFYQYSVEFKNIINVNKDKFS